MALRGGLGLVLVVLAVWPQAAHAIPPPLVVSLGSSLGLPLAALVLAGVLLLARRLGVWAFGWARVLGLLGGAGALALLAWLALAPRSAWLPCDLWGVEDEARYSISADRIGPRGPARMPLLDLRRRRDFRRQRVPGSVHLGVPPSESTASPELLALSRALLQARMQALAREQQAHALALSCYRGCTAQTLVPGLRAAGVEGWAVHEGWAALRRFQPTESASWAAVPPLRTVDLATARAWESAGARWTRLDPPTLHRWMAAPAGHIAEELAPEGELLLLEPPDGQLISVLAARLLGEPGLERVVWVDPGLAPAWAPLAALHRLGGALEHHAGAGAWALLALLAGLLPALVGRRGLERALAREEPGPSGAAVGALVVLLVAVLSAGSPVHAGWASAAVSLLPAGLVGVGALLAAGWERSVRLAGLVAPLRLQADLRSPRPRVRLLPLLLGGAAGGLAAELPLPVAWTAASALLLPAAVELARAGLWRWRQPRAQSGRVVHLARILGTTQGALPPATRYRSRHPHRPGCGAVEVGETLRAVGLFDADAPAGLLAAARLARAAGVDVVVHAGGAALEAATSTPGAALHRQILALPPALAGRSGPVLDGDRLAEAAPAVGELSAELLAQRSGPEGGALRAAAMLGLRRQPTEVYRLGARLYERVGDPARAPGGLLRWTAPAAAELAERLALGWHLRRSLARMDQARNGGPAGLLRALRARPGEGAWVPELVALLGLVGEPGRDHGGPAPAAAHVLGPGGPRGCTVPPPPVLPAARADRRATLRGWLRRLDAAETAVLGEALDAWASALGWGSELFSLGLDELEALRRGDAATRSGLRQRALRRAEEQAALAALSEQLPAQLTVAGLGALDLEALPLAERGRLVAGPAPVEGRVASGAPEPGELVVAHLPSPEQLLAWHRDGILAVLSEAGGALSHVALLARELDLTMVVGLTGARRRLPPGAGVRIEADGTVTRVDTPPSSAPPVVPLREAGPACGGKAVGLARLLRAGLPVPPGLAVRAPAEGEEPGSLEIAEMVLSTGVFADAASLLVRSSALGEDGSRASFAGVLQSLRCAPEPEALAAAIARCRQSAARPVVADYLDAKGIGGPLRLGLVVQPVVGASLGGVLFTRAPGGGGPAVEVSEGGADGAVAGAASVYAGPLAGAQVLPPALRGALQALCPALEAAVGGPCDAEWLWSGELWLVQARPITAG